MFSMALTGLAKSLIVVTASLHPAAAPPAPAPAHYTVRPGDSLSDIARREYGSAADWPALWWINRHAVPDPDVLAAGQRLRLSAWHPRQAWLDRAARAAVAAPARSASAPTAAVAARTGPAPAPPAETSPAATSSAATSPATSPAGTSPAGTSRAGTSPAGTGTLGVRDRPRVRRKRPGRQPGLGCGRPVRVPAQHLAEPGVLRAAAGREPATCRSLLSSRKRPAATLPMGTLRRVLTNRSSGGRPGPGRDVPTVSDSRSEHDVKAGGAGDDPGAGRAGTWATNCICWPTSGWPAPTCGLARTRTRTDGSRAAARRALSRTSLLLPLLDLLLSGIYSSLLSLVIV